MFGRRDEREEASALGEESPEVRGAEPRVGREEARRAIIGKSILITGEVSGEEDLVVEGRVEGRIGLDEQQVTVGPSGRVKAEIQARSVTIEGRVEGNIIARERVVITARGSLVGDITAARLQIEDGAYLKGTVALTPPEREKTIPLSRKNRSAAEPVPDQAVEA